MSSPSLTLQVWLSFRLVATDLCPELPVLTDGVVTLRPLLLHLEREPEQIRGSDG
jgi:hypothetical protein